MIAIYRVQIPFHLICQYILHVRYILSSLNEVQNKQNKTYTYIQRYTSILAIALTSWSTKSSGKRVVLCNGPKPRTARDILLIAQI